MPRRLLDLLTASLLAAALLAAWTWFNQPVREPPLDGRLSGLAYSPYRPGNSPLKGEFPSEAELRADLRLIAERSRGLRLYAAGGGHARIPALAAQAGLEVSLGAWIGRDPKANEADLAAALETAGRAGNATRLVVGNEAVLRGEIGPAALAALLRRARAATRLPVGSAEPWHIWVEHPELAASADFIGVHILPYWEGLSVEQSLSFIAEKVAVLRARYPGKPVVLTEVGWPSHGRQRGAAVPSDVNQASFLRKFRAYAASEAIDYFVIEAFDQPWKQALEGAVGAHWGLFDADRRAKQALEGLVEERPDWRAMALGTVLPGWLLGLLLLRALPLLRARGRFILLASVQGLAFTVAYLWAAYSEEYLTWGGVLVVALLLPAFGILLLSALVEIIELVECGWRAGWQRRGAVSRPERPAIYPKVSIHLPCHAEPPEMVIASLEALASLDYQNFEVLVIDNNTGDPDLWQPLEAACRRLGPRFRFLHVEGLSGYKAGALNLALRHTAADAELIGVIDSDYCVRRDWLQTLVPAFADPKLAIVQAPQDYRDGEESSFKGACYWEYAGFFRLGMVQRNERNAIIQHGTMTLIRRSALEAVGGWDEACICEDAELGLRLLAAGYRANYVENSFGRGLMPDSFAAYRRQRFRWAYGAVQILKKHAADLVGLGPGALSQGQRYHFLAGWMGWIADGLNLLFTLTALVWSLALTLLPEGFDTPTSAFIAAALCLWLFKTVKTASLYALRVRCGVTATLGAMVAGLALSHTAGKAVWRGLLTRGHPFRRTPKCRPRAPLLAALLEIREEVAMLVALLAMAATLALLAQEVGPERGLWVALLLVQALPYAATLTLALAASLGQRPLPA